MEMNIFENKENANNGPRSITILGSTGSIGCSTLDLIKFAPKRFEVVAITGNENVNLLIKQAIAFKPKLAVIGNEQLFNELKEGLSGTKIMVAAGGLRWSKLQKWALRLLSLVSLVLLGCCLL